MRLFLSLLFFLFSFVSAGNTEAPVSESQSSLSSRPIVDLEQLSFLELDEAGVNWRQDWWKYLLMLLLSLLCLCLVVYLTKVLFWLFGVLVCLGSGLAGGLFLDCLFTPWLPPLLPEFITNLVTASLVCHLLGGVLGYGVAACLLALIFRPLKTKKTHA